MRMAGASPATMAQNTHGIPPRYPGPTAHSLRRRSCGRAGTGSVFDLHRWAPSPDAARFVEHFWSVRWDRRDDGPFESTVITFPAVHITREWGDDVVRHGFSLPNTLLHGVVPKVFRTTISARGTVVGARFHPGGFTARFGRDAGDLTLTALIARMREDASLHRVEQVMVHAPWSTRTTQRVFRRYVGVPVKWVLCRYRLQQAALEIESTPGVDFADLAVRLGWYDQAHFSNDFRAMLGWTPGEYARRYGGWRF